MENNTFLQKNSLEEVDRRCKGDIYCIFQTLFLQRKSKQQDLADYLAVNKAYVSRMTHGIQIPPLRIRLKVAEFFSVDSCLIWRDFEIKTAEEEFEDYFASIGIKVN